MTEPKRIVVGMSGGVDSSVSAALLARAGWEVVGVTCDFVCGDSSCCDAADAHAVCEMLGIRHIHADFSPAFAERVIEPFCTAYAEGLTPSPCVGCNRDMKIPALLEIADEVGAEAVATGHYARVVRLPGEDGGPGRFAIRRALDVRKDQSYMLSRLSQEQLSRLVLPLGGMTKPEVRILAEDWGLPVAHRSDSQDLCFAPEGYRALLAEHGVVSEPGPIVDGTGRVLGRHTGLVDYTPGQRSGLGIGGAPEPYYVIGKDAAANTLTVGFAAEALMRRAEVRDMVWQAFDTPPEQLDCAVKLRYRSSAAMCTVRPGEDGTVMVELTGPQPLTAPGQFAVFYSGDTVLGSGIISAVHRD